MKTSKIIIILITVALFFVGLTIYNLILSNNRTFSIINLSKYNMCFLVASDYKIEKTQRGFKYSLRNNRGEFKVIDAPMSKELVKATVGEVEAGYQKLKNDRIFEYKLSDNATLRDKFYIIKKRQPNLVPLKSKCTQLLKRYPVLMELE